MFLTEDLGTTKVFC